MLAMYVGLVIGLISPIQDVFFGTDAEFLFVASTARLVSGPMIGVLSLLVGSTLGAYYYIMNPVPCYRKLCLERVRGVIRPDM